MRIPYALLVLLLALCACGGESLTTIHVDVTADQAWKVDLLYITIGQREPIPRPLEPIEIVVPDEMAGIATPIEISGSASEVPVASGKLDVTPVLHDDVFYTLTLQPLSCGSTCTIGTKMCSANGVATCERKPNGCGAWSTPAACSTPTPFCADGACTSSFPIQVAPGAIHTCATKDNGTVACWGGNSYGQSTPPATQFKSIVSGWYFTCGLRLDDTIQCWGESILTTPPAGAFVKLTAGAHHACAVRADSTFACWGDATLQRSAFTDTRYLAIAAGSEHSCALRLDGTITCVGSNTYGQVSPVPPGAFVSIDSGDAHACAMRANGTVVCWGYTTATTGTPTTAFDSYSVGSTNACGLVGSVLTCWGNNQYGQSAAPAGQYRSVTAGGRHSCAVRTDKTIACWGSNTDGQSTPP